MQGKLGGESLLADCLAIANELKENNREVYRVLTDTNVVWSDHCVENGRAYHSIHMAPVIWCVKILFICICYELNFKLFNKYKHFYAVA